MKVVGVCFRSERWAILGLVVLAACASAAPAATKRQESQESQEFLLLHTSSGAVALDVHSREVRSIPGPLIGAPGYLPMFASIREHGATRVIAIDLTQEGERDVAMIPGDFEVAVASRDASSIVLAPAGSKSVTNSVPQGRSRTRLVNVQSSGESRNFDLRGNFQPEAFSTDGHRLFLIEYIPAEAPDRYSVRELDLRTGTVSPVGGKQKQPAPEEMRGTGRVQTLAPDGKILYTLYTRQVETYPHGQPIEPDPAVDVAVHSFVHVLNLEQGWAHCVDLPHPFGMSSTGDDAMAVSPDGSSLYVVDGTAGVVASIDTDQLQVTKTATIALTTGPSQVFAVVDRENLFLSAGSELLRLNAKTLDSLERSTLGVLANSLVRSGEGRLFVGHPEGVILFDLEGKRTVDRFNVPGILGIALG
ncbi:MAG: hypothetical protein ABIS18_06255 [Actinomycetota bacterium]